MSWRVAQSLLTLLGQVNAAAPGRDKSSDGTIGDAAHQARESDHNAWIIDHGIGVVTALDVTHDPQGGCDAGQLTHALLNSRDSRIKYMIWNHQIVSSNVAPWQWRPYTGQDPHTGHLHLSVKSDKASYDSAALWNLHDFVSGSGAGIHPRLILATNLVYWELPEDGALNSKKCSEYSFRNFNLDLMAFCGIL